MSISAVCSHSSPPLSLLCRPRSSHFHPPSWCCLNVMKTRRSNSELGLGIACRGGEVVRRVPGEAWRGLPCSQECASELHTAQHKYTRPGLQYYHKILYLKTPLTQEFPFSFMFFSLCLMFTWILISCSQLDVSAVIRGPTRKYQEMNYSQGVTEWRAVGCIIWFRAK